MGRKAHPLAARIKKMMQTDEDIGKISQATPVMIARAMELFLQRLCSKSSEIAAQRKAKTLTTSHLKAYIKSDELMDFLQETVAKAPDLPPEGEADAPKPKRQRTGVEGKKEQRVSAEGKRVSGDGGGTTHTATAAAPGTAAASSAAAGAPGTAVAPAAHAPTSAAEAGQHQQVKIDDTCEGSPTAQAAHAKLGHGFGGLGAHPFLAARSFGRPGGRESSKRGPGSSASPKPDSPSHKQQQQQQQHKSPAVGSTGQTLSAAAGLVPQQGHEPVVGLPGVNAQLLATMARTQQEDDYDDDYDS